MIDYAREVRVALSSVREEAADLRFMDLEDSAGITEQKEMPFGL